jgi:hypothetical protein
MKKLTLALLLSMVVTWGLLADKAVSGFYLDQSLQASDVPLGVQLVTQCLYRVPLAKSTGILCNAALVLLRMWNAYVPQGAGEILLDPRLAHRKRISWTFAAVGISLALSAFGSRGP